MMVLIPWSGCLHSYWMSLLCRQETGERCEGIPRDLWKEAWTIGSCLRKVSLDWQIFVCFSIKNLVGKSSSGLNYMYSLSKKSITQICDRPRVTLVRCNRICIWMNVIGNFYNESSNFWNGSICLDLACFDLWNDHSPPEGWFLNDKNITCLWYRLRRASSSLSVQTFALQVKWGLQPWSKLGWEVMVSEWSKDFNHEVI